MKQIKNNNLKQSITPDNNFCKNVESRSKRQSLSGVRLRNLKRSHTDHGKRRFGTLNLNNYFEPILAYYSVLMCYLTRLKLFHIRPNKRIKKYYYSYYIFVIFEWREKLNLVIISRASDSETSWILEFEI